jgi:hypothetical protein
VEIFNALKVAESLSIFIVCIFSVFEKFDENSVLCSIHVLNAKGCGKEYRSDASKCFGLLC